MNFGLKIHIPCQGEVVALPAEGKCLGRNKPESQELQGLGTWGATVLKSRRDPVKGCVFVVADTELRESGG